MHQLRVATRRAQSALRLFADALPRRRSRWWNRQLKRVRKTSGRVRDLDVLIQRLVPQQNRDVVEPLQLIVQDLQRQRRDAQEPLRELRKRACRSTSSGG